MTLQFRALLISTKSELQKKINHIQSKQATKGTAKEIHRLQKCINEVEKLASNADPSYYNDAILFMKTKRKKGDIQSLLKQGYEYGYYKFYQGLIRNSCAHKLILVAIWPSFNKFYNEKIIETQLENSFVSFTYPPSTDNPELIVNESTSIESQFLSSENDDSTSNNIFNEFYDWEQK